MLNISGAHCKHKETWGALGGLTQNSRQHSLLNSTQLMTNSQTENPSQPTACHSYFFNVTQKLFQHLYETTNVILWLILTTRVVAACTALQGDVLTCSQHVCCCCQEQQGQEQVQGQEQREQSHHVAGCRAPLGACWHPEIWVLQQETLDTGDRLDTALVADPAGDSEVHIWYWQPSAVRYPDSLIFQGDILISWYTGILISWYTDILISWYPRLLRECVNAGL